MVNAIWYRFQECQCLDVRGVIRDIPEGCYAGVELSAVKVIIGNQAFDLDKNAFNQLKADGKVRKV